MIGKINQLPPAIQEQLNQRLENKEETNTILAWVNALPEVQAVLQEKFEGKAINPQNLSDHRAHGFIDWQARQQALEFAANLNIDDAELRKVLPVDLAEKLSRWVSIRYATATRALSTTDSGLDSELRHLRGLCILVLALRRGEINAGRLALEQQRLSLEMSDTAQAKEKEFWEWTTRPDIQAKLYPNRDPDQIRRDVVKMLDRELLGVPAKDQLEETADPGILI